MATKLLNQRIKDVMCARKRAGKADITPTLNDCERTHILYVNAHFKPLRKRISQLCRGLSA